MYAAANAIIRGEYSLLEKMAIHKQHSKQLCREDAAALCLPDCVTAQNTVATKFCLIKN